MGKVDLSTPALPMSPVDDLSPSEKRPLWEILDFGVSGYFTVVEDY